MAVDPKNSAEPTINVFVSQLCEEIRTLKSRVNFLESQTIRAPGTEVLSALPSATARALKTLTFNSAGGIEATAPVAGDYAEFAVELGNRLKRDGTQGMLAELELAGNAVQPLGAVPKQQAESISNSAVEQYRGTDSRISKLPPTTYLENFSTTMIAQLADGRLVGWGRAEAGNTGTGQSHATAAGMRPAFCQFSPRIPSGVTVAGFIVGSSDSFVWLSNGWVYHSGLNVRGIGGHGAAGIRRSFTRIQFFVTSALSVVDVQCVGFRTDDQFSAALFRCSNGDVYYAGYTDGGTAGDGSNVVRSLLTPVKVLTVSGAVGATMGGSVLSGRFAWNAVGQCWAWGTDSQGLLGLGAPATTHTPALVPGVLVDKVVTRSSTNSGDQPYGFSLFLLKDGTVRAAGANLYGALGDGTTTNRSNVVTCAGLSNVIDIGAGGGDYHWAWAITSAKELWVWGDNRYGALGVGDVAQRNSPTQPVGWIDEAGTEVTTGAPPFQGKVVKVVTSKTVSGGPVGRAQTVVLDEDGNVWSAGEDRVTAANEAGDTRNSRFKRAQLGAVPPGDKIVDVHYQGHASAGVDMRLFAVTQQGRLLMSGKNDWTLGTAMPNTAGANLGNHNFIFLQPVRLGV